MNATLPWHPGPRPSAAPPLVNTISGIDELRSTTIEGQSQVFVSFILDRDIEAAAQDVREKVATVLSQLPQGTEAPVIEKFDVDAAPVLALVVSGRRSPREITELADKRIKRALEGVKDIGAVTLVGQRKREIQIAVDPNRLAAYGLSIQQMQRALQRQNVEVPGGRLTGGTREEGLRTLGRVTAVADFESIVVAETPRGRVRLRDVAQVLDAEEEPRTLSRLDGNNAVSLLVRKQSGTNTVAVVDRVKARLTDLRGTLPPDVTIDVVRDQSRFIKRGPRGGPAPPRARGAPGEPDRVGLPRLAELAPGAHPITIMVSMFLAIPFGLLALVVSGMTLNIYAIRGMFLLIGVVKKNAILQVDYTNVLQGRGLSRFETQIEADRARLRPILMTTFAIVFGMLPVALGRGDGSASRAALAIAVVGGQALCLVVTLVITPVVYSFFDDLRGWPRRLLARRPAWRPRAARGRRLEAGLNGRPQA